MSEVTQAVTQGTKKGIDKVLAFFANTTGEVGAEIIGTAGYHTIADLWRKWFGKKPSDHEHPPPPAHPEATLDVDKEGKGFGDEQGMLQEWLAVRGRMGVTTEEYDAASEWLRRKSKKYKQDFRKGYFHESDKNTRLRFVVRFCKLPSDEHRDREAERSGYIEPHGLKDETEQLIHDQLPGVNQSLREANERDKNSRFCKASNWLIK